MPHTFTQVDVFGAAPFLGNPVAVVHDADGLSAGRMQQLARWFDLSETVFLSAADAGADYHARIFTPAEELPFAGHPTLGACHAWLAAGGVPAVADRIVQRCGAGPVELRPDRAGRTAFAGPPLVRDEEVDDDDLGSIAAILGVARDAIVAARWVDNGPGWVAVRLATAAAVLGVEVDLTRDPRDGPRYLGLVADADDRADHDLEVRALFPDGSGTLREDPATGSLAAALGRWLADTGELDGRFDGALTLRQGTRLRRDARLHVRHDAQDRIWVAGATVASVRGTIDLDA